MAWWRETFGSRGGRRQDRAESRWHALVFGLLPVAVFGSMAASAIGFEGRQLGVLVLLGVSVPVLFFQTLLELFVAHMIGMRPALLLLMLWILVYLLARRWLFLTVGGA